MILRAARRLRRHPRLCGHPVDSCLPETHRLADEPFGSVAAGAGLEELLPQAVLALDRERTAKLFRILQRLVATTQTYRLHFGRDAAELPKLFDPLFPALRAAA